MAAELGRIDLLKLVSERLKREAALSLQVADDDRSLHRFDSDLRCPAEGKNGVWSERQKGNGKHDCFCELSQASGKFSANGEVHKYGLVESNPRKTIPQRVSFFLPIDRDLWGVAHQNKTLLPDSRNCSTVLATVLSDKYFLIPDEILGVVKGHPFAVHVTASPREKISVDDVREVAKAKAVGFMSCWPLEEENRRGSGGSGGSDGASDDAGREQSRDGEGGDGDGGFVWGDGGSGGNGGADGGGGGRGSASGARCRGAAVEEVAYGYGTFLDLAVSLLEWVATESTSDEHRLLALCYQLDIAKHYEVLHIDSAEELIEISTPTLRRLLLKGYELSVEQSDGTIRGTDAEIASHLLVTALGVRPSSVVSIWGNRTSVEDLAHTRPFEVPLSSCSTQALKSAAYFGGRAVVVGGSMTIKVSGLPHQLAERVLKELQEDEEVLAAARAELKEGTDSITNPLDLLPPVVFESRTLQAEPAFQLDDKVPFGDDDIYLPVNVTVFGPILAHQRFVISTSLAVVEMLALLRGELDPSSRYRWWVARRQGRFIDFLEMCPRPTPRQRAWATHVRKEVLRSVPGLEAVPSSGAGVEVKDDQDAYCVLLTWSDKVRKQAVPSIERTFSAMQLWKRGKKCIKHIPVQFDS